MSNQNNRGIAPFAGVTGFREKGYLDLDVVKSIKAETELVLISIWK